MERFDYLCVFMISRMRPGNIRMYNQFFQTGITMVDLFFTSFRTALEMQRAFVSGGTVTALGNAKFGHSDQSSRFETGATEEPVIPIPKRQLRIGKRQVQSPKAYRVSTKVEVFPKASDQPQVKSPRETSPKAGVKAAHDSGVVEKQKKVKALNLGRRKDCPNLGGDTKPRGTRKFHRRRSAAR
jgi:hypothetical protein